MPLIGNLKILCLFKTVFAFNNLELSCETSSCKKINFQGKKNFQQIADILLWKMSYKTTNCTEEFGD